jgi:hypothetical protein
LRVGWDQLCNQPCGKIIQRRLKGFIRNKKILLVHREFREEFYNIGTCFGIAWRAYYFTRGIAWCVLYLWKHVLFPHLHNRLEVARLIGSVEWLYHGHP